MGTACGMHGWRRVMHIGFWWEIGNEINHSDDLDIVKRIILKWSLEI
jgi:hypothetical protein